MAFCKDFVNVGYWPGQVRWCSTISVSILEASVHKRWVTPAVQVISSPQETGTELRSTETNPWPERQMTSMSKSAECSSIVAFSANRRLAMTSSPLRNRTRISTPTDPVLGSGRHSALCTVPLPTLLPYATVCYRVSCHLCPESAPGRPGTLTRSSINMPLHQIAICSHEDGRRCTNSLSISWYRRR